MLLADQPIVIVNEPVPFEEKVRDHNAILEAFFNTHVLSHHSIRTQKFDRWFLHGWFSGYKMRDDAHPYGRQLFVWEAMEPMTGPEIIRSYSAGLSATDLSARTCGAYMGRLHYFFRHVCDRPYIPSGSIRDPVLISDKYNTIANPVSRYLYPPPRATEALLEYPLVEEGLNEFLCWIREYLPKARNPFTAARTYTEIITAADCGFRYCEIAALDALQPTRDIFPRRGTIRTRSGKATNGSGPRTREVTMTPLTRATLKHYEACIRPEFPKAETNPSLFLSGRGARLSYFVATSALKTLVRKARGAGLVLPNDMGWHSFRRSFATQYLRRHPDGIWDLLRLMGQQNALSLIRYVRPSEAAVNEGLGRILERLTMRRAA